jgi:hypothetical protein
MLHDSEDPAEQDNAYDNTDFDNEADKFHNINIKCKGCTVIPIK